MKHINVIGAGLAGCEAAYQISKRGIKVKLYEAKPKDKSKAHKSDNFCELVCSNSLKGTDLATAGGLLKEELKLLDSFVLSCAYETAVSAGGALAVEREKFSALVSEKIKSDKNIEIINCVKDSFDENEITVIATGPLTLGGLEVYLKEKLNNNLYFYDAAAPIIDAESIDRETSFMSSRYNKGGADYINCPLEKSEYELFWNELVKAESAQLHDFDKREIFEGCMPVEIMAKRGIDTLRFGPLRPVGFIDPKTGKRPYAVVQLRKENEEGTMYNIVGFQTNLKFAEQKRVFSLIPALKNSEFFRYGVMHRNSYIDAPKTINSFFQCKEYKNIFIGGQLSGVEGYVESIASGLMAGINAAKLFNNDELLTLPKTTIIGALSNYLQTPNPDFQPINASFGVLPPLEKNIKDKALRKIELSRRSIEEINKVLYLI